MKTPRTTGRKSALKHQQPLPSGEPGLDPGLTSSSQGALELPAEANRPLIPLLDRLKRSGWLKLSKAEKEWFSAMRRFFLQFFALFTLSRMQRDANIFRFSKPVSAEHALAKSHSYDAGKNTRKAGPSVCGCLKFYARLLYGWLLLAWTVFSSFFVPVFGKDR
eukprot:GSA120T00011687001.1